VYLIDSHVHLDDDRLAMDFTEVLNRARKAGVAAQVIPATHVGNWPRIQQLCSQHPDLYACYGLGNYHWHESFACPLLFMPTKR